MSKLNLLAATMHTAGIYSDMTVDGPEIGTLVVVVDRAKNLPNRKTIGKQDPYCAARLGKEAKKTETDRRGGQTPRWDQEMRFTVHDSPDYYQLKVSVFNDDKKTEVIGETWVNLSEVVVPGGGKNDLWHNLSFKGKYAGEIRIEITYYDTRPKAEKSAEKKKQVASKEAQDASRDPMSGPRQMKAVKRRPLPNNPITDSPPLARSAAAVAGQSQTPGRGRVPEPVLDHPQNISHSGGRGPPTSDYAQDHILSQVPARGRPLPAQGTGPDYTQTPRGHQPSQEYQPNQPPLQQVEYNTPLPRFSQSNSNQPSPFDINAYPVPLESNTPTTLPASDRYEIYDPAPPGSEYISENTLEHYDNSMDDRDVGPLMTYHAQPEQGYYVPQSPDEYSAPLSPGGPPPPPPLHGARRASPFPPPAASDTWDMPNFGENANAVILDDPYDPTRHVKHRQSMPAYAHTKLYQAYSPPREHQRPQSRDQRPPSRDQRPQSRDHFENTPRHHSYDDHYHIGFESMQPTVEDAPPSPGPGNHRSSFSRGYDDRHFDSPAPLNIGGRGSAASGPQSASAQSGLPMSNGYPSAGSPASFVDRTQNTSMSSHRSSLNQQYQPPRRRESEDRVGGSPGGPNVPQVPSSLVAGIDPTIAQEISERIYNDRRGSFNNASMFPRNGGYFPESVQPPYQQSRPTSSYGRQDASSVFVPASTPNSFSQSMVLANGSIRERSPAPIGSQRDSRALMRKSVSPAPTSRDRSRSPAPFQSRRLSGIPFGPDDYDALNPNIGAAASKSVIQFSGATEPKQKVTSSEKIISHDGREIDPSDYLPVDTYAAEYEKKVAPKPTQPPLQTAASLALARPRSQGRPFSMVPASNSSVYMIKPNPSPGRTRLQKKSARINPPAQVPTPLAPLTSYHDNTNSFTPRPLGRASTGDFQLNENYAPSTALTHYGSHISGSYGVRGDSAPPIPAKIPVHSGGGMNGGNMGMGSFNQVIPRAQAVVRDPSDQAWSLLEEMKSIDLGTGSSRTRHGRRAW